MHSFKRSSWKSNYRSGESEALPVDNVSLIGIGSEVKTVRKGTNKNVRGKNDF